MWSANKTCLFFFINSLGFRADLICESIISTIGSAFTRDNVCLFKMNKLSWYQIIDSRQKEYSNTADTKLWMFRCIHHLVERPRSTPFLRLRSGSVSGHYWSSYARLVYLTHRRFIQHFCAWAHEAPTQATLLLGWSANQKSARSVLLSLLQLCHTSSMLRSNPYRCKECSDVSTIT